MNIVSQIKALFIVFTFIIFNFSIEIKAQEDNIHADIPADKLYEGIWRNDHVRAARLDKINKQSFLICVLDSITTTFAIPAEGKVISKFGKRGKRMHTGTDIKQRKGDTIRAAFEGLVRMSRLYSGYGNVVVIRHYNGLETLYSHNSKNLVDVNDYVKAGEPIALAGRTGRATTEHLHFETRFLMEPFNPEMIFDFEKGEIKNNYLKCSKGRISVKNVPNSTAYDVTEVIDDNDDLDEDMDTVLLAETNVNKSAPKDSSNKNIKSPDKKSKTQTASAKKSKTKYHTVKQGETLYSLAKRYGCTVDDLRKWNKIGKDNRISIGKKLVVSK